MLYKTDNDKGRSTDVAASFSTAVSSFPQRDNQNDGVEVWRVPGFLPGSRTVLRRATMGVCGE